MCSSDLLTNQMAGAGMLSTKLSNLAGSTTSRPNWYKTPQGAYGTQDQYLSGVASGEIQTQQGQALLNQGGADFLTF